MLLQVFAVAVMVIPSDTVIAPIGAAGYPASLVGVGVGDGEGLGDGDGLGVVYALPRFEAIETLLIPSWEHHHPTHRATTRRTR